MLTLEEEIEKGKSKLSFYIISVVSLGILIFVVYLYLENNRLANDKIVLNNKIAELDTLHRVLLNDKNILFERASKQEKDLNKVLDENNGLKQYLKEKDGKLLALASHITSLEIKNLELSGKIQKDTIGEYAVFDTTNKFFDIEAIARFRPQTTLHISNFMVRDSSYIGFYKQEHGFLTGFITHTNPYLEELSANFALPIIQEQRNGSPFIEILEIGGVAITAGVIIGLLIGK